MPERPITAIGRVRNAIPLGTPAVAWSGIISTIELELAYAPGLDRIEEFSHLYVIFRLEGEEIDLRAHPRKKADLPKVGVFATRSPRRPNPLGLTLVRLLEHRGNVLIVQGLDAWDGTLVLDLKPFMLRALPDDLRFPAWMERLEAKGDKL